MTASWLDAMTATIGEAAESAYAAAAAATGQVGEDLAAALARVQALPAEAAAAVADLTAALDAWWPGDLAQPSALESAGPAPAGAGSGPPTGNMAAIEGAIVPRRFTVDPAALAAFIRAQHPVKPAEHAAARTRLPVETVAKILARESLGNGRTLLFFIAGYGPELLAAVMPGADERWLHAARIVADGARLEAEIARTRAEAAANAGRWSLCGIGFGGAS